MDQSLMERFSCRANQLTFRHRRVLLQLCKQLFALILFFSLTTQSNAGDVTLGWDANSESDQVTSYSIHYKIGSSGPPYDGTGASEGDSPIIVSIAELSDPGNPQYSLHGLIDNETYFFALTASNNSGQSGYSNEVSHYFASNSVPEDNGGGGGGCFIATATFGSPLVPHVQILRAFRDRFLDQNRLGNFLVKAYYRYSPPMAHYIAQHKNVKRMVRLGLLPIVGGCWFMLTLGQMNSVVLILIFGFLIICVYAGYRLRKAK